MTASPLMNETARRLKKSRGQLKRLKQKDKQLARVSTKSVGDSNDEVEYMSRRSPEIKAELYADLSDQVNGDIDSTLTSFSDVFARFQLPSENGSQIDEADIKDHIEAKGEVIYSDDELPSEDEGVEEDEQISKRKQRKLNRLSVAELKRLVKKPEVVEWVDVSATDPKLLVQLKSNRNSVPIPPHWSQKRDYLQGKRGIEKPPFQLPSFIADTGIASQRDAVKEKEETQSLKAKTRERVQPKMGKIDIDYQKLHDAFFKYQTKPKMTEFGELYYEGKEFETKLKEKRPGDISDELKEALSIPPLAPPPWLISMQRYGPPPSYPNLKISGLNAPIPEGAAWGFHPGGWGKPPLDDYGRPLYGDIYGVAPKYQTAEAGEPVNRIVWGELEPDEEDTDEEESEEEDEEDARTHTSGPGDGLATLSGLDTPSGLASVTSTVPGGLETPDFLDLRKRRESTHDEGPRQLYQVIPEREAKMRGFMGSDRAYDVSNLAVAASAPAPPLLGQEERMQKRKAGGVDVALDAAELGGLSEAELRSRYEAAGRSGTHEDFSDYVEKEASKRRRVDEARRKDGKDRFRF